MHLIRIYLLRRREAELFQQTIHHVVENYNFDRNRREVLDFERSPRMEKEGDVVMVRPTIIEEDHVHERIGRPTLHLSA